MISSSFRVVGFPTEDIVFGRRWGVAGNSLRQIGFWRGSRRRACFRLQSEAYLGTGLCRLLRIGFAWRRHLLFLLGTLIFYAQILRWSKRIVNFISRSFLIRGGRVRRCYNSLTRLGQYGSVFINRCSATSAPRCRCPRKVAEMAPSASLILRWGRIALIWPGEPTISVVVLSASVICVCSSMWRCLVALLLLMMWVAVCWVRKVLPLWASLRLIVLRVW